MARLSLIVFLVSATLHTTWGYALESPRNLRINGGEFTPIEYAPYMAAVFQDKNLWCGASIIDKQFVLTAAHCVHKTNKNYTVLVGSDQLNTEGIFIDVEKILCHEEFNPTTTENDICLLKLKETVPFGCLWSVEKIALPSDDRNILGDSLASVLGWGSHGSGASVSNELREALVPVLGNDCCRRIYPDVKDSMICAGFKDRNFCSGDSGGPLVYNNLLIGVASWDGHGCDSKPGVYTRVSSYLSWIQETMFKNRL